jgi:acyl-CoA synthetase (AMP-forming)/AMP-acid ligase II
MPVSPGGRSAYDWLCEHAVWRPGAAAVTGWDIVSGAGTRLTFAELRRATDEMVAGLRSGGARPGDRVMIVLPNDPCFWWVFLGCVGAGAIAVPGPVPTVARPDAAGERIERLSADCRPVLLVTDARWEAQLAQIWPDGHSCRIVSWQELRAAGAAVESGRRDRPGPAPRIAFLQYTSGSTGSPKGIVITHEALAASCGQAAQAYAEHAADVAVTWVPLYHDMGLVTGLMRPLFSGYASVLMRPDHFSRAPSCWLEAIHHCGGTLSSAPNFAFELCVRKVPQEQVRALDLSRWRVARNAGEVVRPSTADRFIRHFAAARFPPESMCPSYGLAEATLAVTTCGPRIRPARLAVRADELDRGRVFPADPGAPGARELLSSGVPVAGTRVRAGDGEDQIAEIAISGPQLSPGRWRRDGLVPCQQDPGRWHRTGDVGFLHKGHLFVLGRTDDTVVYQGRNFYASDVVAACGTVAGLRPGRLAVFLRSADTTGLDAVFAVAELRSGTETAPSALAGLGRQVKTVLAESLGLYVTSVRFVPPGALPVTTSGKVRVSEARRRFEAGRLPLLPVRDVSRPGHRDRGES